MITSELIAKLCQRHQGALQNDLIAYGPTLTENQVIGVSQVMVNYVEAVLIDVVSEIMREVDSKIRR